MGRPRNPLKFDQYLLTDKGCWHWLRALTPNGYPKTRHNGKTVSVHRYNYERFKGPIPEGKQIDHLCKNTACINPAHLEAVTPAINIQRSRLAVLNLDIVKEIRERSARTGLSSSELAKDYGVQRRQISRILKNERWKIAA